MSNDEEPTILSLLEGIIIGRNEFLTEETFRVIPFNSRPTMIARYMTNESMLLEFLNRVYLNDTYARNAAATLITLTLPNNGSSFMEPVTVSPSVNQVNNSLEDFQNTNSSCAVCQEVISSGACRIRQCGHVYHRSCIVNWFSMSVRCPVCRHDIREESRANQTSAASEQTSSQERDQLAEHDTSE